MGARSATSIWWRSALLVVLVAVAACHRESSGDPDAGLADLGDPSLDAACATGGAKATLKRLNLVFVYDRSGSMGDGMNGNDPALKWIPVGAGMRAFFEDAESLGVKAQLSYFPYKKNMLEQCNASAYFFPDVPLTALPSATFGADLDATTPSGQTPTLPAIQGGIAAAQEVASADPTAKIAIVLVTDGEPDICNSSVQTVSGAVAPVAASIPTYVIGIGLSMNELGQIATAGGTGAPIVVTVGDPDKTRADIQAAFNAIRKEQVPCAFPLPSPPPGMALDIDKVNVLYTPTGGPQVALARDPECATGKGWRYDDPLNPTQVVLCPETCATIQKDPGAALDILFGCGTKVL
jgi:hypothetical protein